MTEPHHSVMDVQRAAIRRGYGEQEVLTESWGLMAGCPNLLALPALVGWGGSCTTHQRCYCAKRLPILGILIVSQCNVYQGGAYYTSHHAEAINGQSKQQASA